MCLLLESIKIKNGIIYNLPLHQKRMNEARKKLFGCRDEIVLTNKINITEPYKTGLIKCRILYEKEIQRIEFIAYRFPSIHSLQIVHDNSLDYTYKTADRSAIEAVYNQRGNADEVLIIKNGFITDTSFCNIVLCKEEDYFTPDTFLLNGIKRQQLLHAGKIREKSIPIDQLKEYDSLYLINALIDIEDQICINVRNINEAYFRSNGHRRFTEA